MTETCVCKNCTARETCPFYDPEEESDECVYKVLAAAAKNPKKRLDNNPRMCYNTIRKNKGDKNNEN